MGGIKNITRKSGEELFNFFNRLVAKCHDFRKFMNSTFSDRRELVDARVELADEYALDTFIKAIGMNFRPLVVSRKPRTLQEAFNYLRDLEMETGCTSNDSADQKLSEVLELLKTVNLGKASNKFADPQVSRLDVPNEVGVSNNQVVCRLCDRVGHKALNIVTS